MFKMIGNHDKYDAFQRRIVDFKVCKTHFCRKMVEMDNTGLFQRTGKSSKLFL